MKITKPDGVTFGIYHSSKLTHYGTKTTGFYNDYKIDIYTAQKDNRLDYKLYYLSKAGKWIKSKLVYFKNNKKKEIIRGERKRDYLV